MLLAVLKKFILILTRPQLNVVTTRPARQIRTLTAPRRRHRTRQRPNAAKPEDPVVTATRANVHQLLEAVLAVTATAQQRVVSFLMVPNTDTTAIVSKPQLALILFYVSQKKAFTRCSQQCTFLL